MIATRFHRVAVAIVGAAVLPLALSACSSDDSAGSTKEKDTKAAAPEQPQSPAAGAADAMNKPFGPACSSIPKTGAGSFDGMSTAPVATAASNNPALSTLVTAVKKAGLVDTLNSAQNITVFAPTNDAFAKLPKADLDKVLSDKATLTKILTYHVVGQKLTPEQLGGGTFPTLQKSTLSTSGSGESFKVNHTANVVCGNVPTANATVYIIDSVLMPAA